MPGLLGSGGALGATEVETLRKALEQEREKSAALEAELEKTRSEMQARIDKARDELSTRLEELFASVTWKSDPEVAVLRQKLDAAGVEIAGLTSAKENTKAYATRLEARLRSINEKVEGLEEAARAEATRVRDRLAAKDEEIEGLKAAVAEAEAARDETAELVDQARAKQDVWANRVVGANEAALIAAADAQALREKLGGLEAKLEEVGGERDTLKLELAEAESVISERIERVFAAASGENSSELDSLREELEASNKQIVSLKASSREAKELKQKLSSLQAESETLKAKAEKAESARAKAEARLEETQSGTRGQIAELRKTTETLTADAGKLRKDAEASKRRVEALTAERNAAKKEIGELAAILQATQQQAEGLQDALTRSMEARKKLGAQLQAALVRSEAKGKALAASGSSAAETAKLRQQLADSKRELARIKQDLARSQAEVTAARGEISQRIGKLIAVAAEKEISADVVQLKEKLAAAEQEIDRLNAALEEQQEAGSVNN